jgi:ribosomal protein S18 acetylase RimI-like enzyme
MMGRALEVRKATRADVAAIGRLAEINEMFPADMLDNMIAPYFTGNEDELWFVIGEEPVAVAYAVPEKLTNGTWNQLMIAVDPEQHGRGLGKALMRNLEQVVAERGGRLVLAETSGVPEFEPTRAFYRAIGYNEEARIRNFWDEGDDKIVFTRELGR